MNLAQPDLLADAGAHSATLVLALEHPDADGIEPLPVFWLTEEQR